VAYETFTVKKNCVSKYDTMFPESIPPPRSRRAYASVSLAFKAIVSRVRNIDGQLMSELPAGWEGV